MFEEMFLAFGLFAGASSVIATFVIYSKVIKDRMWPIRIPLIVQRGKGEVWQLDERGKIIKRKDGTSAIWLKNEKKPVKPPKYSSLGMTNKGKPVLPLFKNATNQFLHVNVTNPVGIEVVEDASATNWLFGEIRRTNEMYAPKENKLLTLLPFIMSATFAAMVIFFIIYFGGKMEIMTNQLSSAAGALANAMVAFKAAPPP